MQETNKPGEYYLGDPSFAITNEELYYDVYGEEYGFKSGKFDLTKKGDHLITHTTHNGDGIFFDTKKRKYKVESGMIGLVPVKLIENIDEAKKYGKIFDFPSFVTFTYNGGKFYVKSGNYIIEINTINEDEYDSDDEEHFLIDGNKVNIRNDDDDSSIDDIYSDDEIEDINTEQNKKPIFFKS